MKAKVSLGIALTTLLILLSVYAILYIGRFVKVNYSGDSDTIAAITGSIAEAFYGVPEEMKNRARSYLDTRLLGIWDAFDEMIGYGQAAEGRLFTRTDVNDSMDERKNL